MQAQAWQVQDVDGLVDYDAFVVGRAVFAGHWIPEPSSSCGATLPFCTWSGVAVQQGSHRHTAKQYDIVAGPKITELRRALGPRGHRIFFGAWDPRRLNRGRLGSPSG